MREQIMINEQVERNRGIVMCADGYDRVDGRNAYRSRVKRMTLGWPGASAGTIQDTGGLSLKNTEPVVQLWEAAADGQLNHTVEIPIHQVLDMTLFLCRTLQHFREAYRLPLLYDPEKPVVERLGLQGDAMTVSVCTDNPSLNEEIRSFSQAIGDLGELTGERLRALVHILDEMEMYCNGE